MSRLSSGGSRSLSISWLGSSKQERDAGALLSPGGPLGNALELPAQPGSARGSRMIPGGHLASPELGLVAPTRCCPLAEVSCSCGQEGWSPRSPWLGFSSLALELKDPNSFLGRPRIPVTLNMKMVMPSWSVLWVAGVGGTLLRDFFGE